jgi:hypothetical protein
MLWPQVVRGVAIMFLPAAADAAALGHLTPNACRTPAACST